MDYTDKDARGLANFLTEAGAGGLDMSPNLLSIEYCHRKILYQFER